jgi:AcrR family transcriptional regulator
MTHRGFYKHFGSKDKLLVESLSGASGRSPTHWFMSLTSRP